jgi:hypothetical protein
MKAKEEVQLETVLAKQEAFIKELVTYKETRTGWKPCQH